MLYSNHNLNIKAIIIRIVSSKPKFCIKNVVQKNSGKNDLIQKFLVQKLFGTKNIWAKKVKRKDTKKFLVQKILGSK